MEFECVVLPLEKHCVREKRMNMLESDANNILRASMCEAGADLRVASRLGSVRSDLFLIST